MTIIIFLNRLNGLAIHGKLVNPKKILDVIVGLKIKLHYTRYIILLFFFKYGAESN